MAYTIFLLPPEHGIGQLPVAKPMLRKTLFVTALILLLASTWTGLSDGRNSPARGPPVKPPKPCFNLCMVCSQC